MIWIDAGYYSISPLLAVKAQDAGAVSNSVILRGATGPTGSVLDRGDPTDDVVYMDVEDGDANYVRFESLRFTGGDRGLYIRDLTGIEIVDCYSYGNDTYGIRTRDCIDLVLSNNVCYDNPWYGVHIYNAEGPVVVGNRCYGSTYGFYGDGIQVGSADNVVITDNVCYENENRGIDLSLTTTTNSVSGNECYLNGSDGIYVTGGSSKIADNRVYENGGHGIFLDDGEGALERNIIHDNTGYGIYVANSDNKVEVLNNSLYGYNGVYFSYPLAVTNRNNIIWARGSGNYAVNVPSMPGTRVFHCEENNLYTTEGASVGNWLGTPCATMTDWRAASTNDTNSISSAPLFADPEGLSGLRDFHLMSRAGSYYHGTWAMDGTNSPSIDTADSWGAFSNETSYNGLRLNQGAYGNTPEASRTYYTGPFYTISLSSTPVGAGRADQWPIASSYPTNREITVWATATNVSYQWGEWLGDLTGTNTPSSFYVTGDTTITALFWGLMADVSGTVTYAGSQTGLIWVVATTEAGSWDTNYCDVLAAPGGYAVANLLKYTNYWLKAYRDSDGSGTREPTEAWGEYVSNALYLTNDISGIDIILIDPSVVATVSGTISYTGPQTGLIWIVAVTNVGAWTTNYFDVVTVPGAYSITNIPVPTNYWFKAYRDSNGNAAKDYWEAFGEYVSNPAYLTNDVAGIDMTLTDPDGDTDSMPDWWEVLHFAGTNHPQGDGDYDWDGDGLVNSNEYLADTIPTNLSSVFQTMAVSKVGGIKYAISFKSVTSRTYQVQSASDPAVADWASNQCSLTEGGPLSWNRVMGTGAVTTVFVENTNNYRSYRIGVKP